MRTVVVSLAALLAAAGGCSQDEELGDDLAQVDAGSDPDAEGETGQPGLPCVTSLSCEAREADTECGVLGETGLRPPERGAPYCSDRRSRDRCHCDLLRCSGRHPLCPGTYRLSFRERLVAGCDGVPGQLGGTCPAVWNVLELVPQGLVLAERALLNTQLSWDFADYAQQVTLTGTTPVRLVVQQYAWFRDVSGAGHAGRVEVSHARIALE
ncbi:MAG: hypothetical protein RMK29_13255 [Myxococcales bacterium]|nr:hypothetical protein [Myxococcota bacterium]MDW8282674.1 hypothetical protein [Myxococcales bacterium]